MNPRSKGFSVVEVMILLGVVVLIAGVGFVGWKAFVKAPETAAESTSGTNQSAEVITTKSDLEQAAKSLDELNFDDESSAQAETQASL